jgi:tRNA pseudouridine38-40 synthase
MRYFFSTSYKGTSYHGWQKQPNAISVQQRVEEVFSIILNNEIEIVGSGRTDTGVHATQQFFHVDLNNDLKVDQLFFNANKMLPKDISLIDFKSVNPEAHARFDAISRSYEYKIIQTKNPFGDDLAYYFTKELNITEMNKACEELSKHTDFESFSKVKTDVFTFNCEIFEAEWKQAGEILVFSISANRFLRGMVRTIVGTLLEVGQDRLTIEEFKTIILTKSRHSAGRSVPAHGLYLTKVLYPEKIYL